MNTFFKITLFILALGFSVNAQNLTINFTTKNLPANQGYQYSPNHVLALWIENSTGRFVNSIAKYGNQRDYNLYSWIAKSGGFNDDGISGATLRYHIARSFNWNMKNYIGMVVTDGTYNVCVEFTSKDNQGPVYKFPITLSGENFTLTPANETYLTNISIVYNTGQTSVANNENQQGNLEITPNPLQQNSEVTLHQSYATDITFKLISVTGKVLDQKQVKAQTGTNQFKINQLFSSIPSGVLFIVAETGTYSLAQKVINQ